MTVKTLNAERTDLDAEDHPNSASAMMATSWKVVTIMDTETGVVRARKARMWLCLDVVDVEDDVREATRAADHATKAAARAAAMIRPRMSAAKRPSEPEGHGSHVSGVRE